MQSRAGSAEKLMHRVYQTFIDLLSSAEDAEGFSKAMANTAAAMDLSCFAYVALPRRPSKEPLIISTYPADGLLTICIAITSGWIRLLRKRSRAQSRSGGVWA